MPFVTNISHDTKKFNLKLKEDTNLVQTIYAEKLPAHFVAHKK